MEATIGQWLKKVGESVKPGEAVVELETDKVNLEVAAEEEGILEEIIAGEGASVGVGSTLAVIRAGAAAPSSSSKEPESIAPLTPKGDHSPDTMIARATPDVRRLAAEHGLDMGQLSGSGPRGRVTREDVVQQAGDGTPAKPSSPSATSGKANTASVPSPSSVGSDSRPVRRVPMSSRRLTIARRLVEAQHSAAMLTTFNEVDMTQVLAVRARRKDAFKERYGVGLGFMSFFTKATIGALKLFPQLNAEIQGNEMILKEYYDIGIAVSTESGLVVPVVRDADKLTFAEIERSVAELAGKARQNKLSLKELQGGSFTITNGGIFGSLLSTPILNAPQVGILGMHKIEERPVAVHGSVVIRPMMYLALSYDHRIVDGSEAVRFLVAIKEFLEDPEKLLLEG